MGMQYNFTGRVTGRNTPSIKLEVLRYMPRSDIGEETAHGIPIRLLGVECPDSKAGKFYYWNQLLVAKVVDKLIKDDVHLLRITLRNGHYSQALGCVKWDVKCDVTLLEDLNEAGEPTRIKTVHSNIGKKFLSKYLALSKRKKQGKRRKSNSPVKLTKGVEEKKEVGEAEPVPA